MNDMSFMLRALALAKRGQYTARPNPCVGAVLVRDGVIVGEGYHAYYGGDHAEVMALKQAGERARGASCYVTLEPCSHQGKTPPCTDALIHAGVKKVVAATLDPNPLVRGKGFEKLREAGVDVEVGMLALNAQRLNRAFFKRILDRRPRVILKSAMSLDGRTAMESGESKWITSEAARAQVQILRAQSDAVITGRGTVEMDNPNLNVRDENIMRQKGFKQPRRIVLDSQGRIKQAKLTALDGEAWHVTTGAHSAWENHVVMPEKAGQLDLQALLQWLHCMPCNQVMVEAGATLAGRFLQEGLLDEWHVFIAPKIMGSHARPLCDMHIKEMAQANGLTLVSAKPLGEDLYCIFEAV